MTCAVSCCYMSCYMATVVYWPTNVLNVSLKNGSSNILNLSNTNVIFKVKAKVAWTLYFHS